MRTRAARLGGPIPRSSGPVVGMGPQNRMGPTMHTTQIRNSPGSVCPHCRRPPQQHTRSADGRLLLCKPRTGADWWMVSAVVSAVLSVFGFYFWASTAAANTACTQGAINGLNAAGQQACPGVWEYHSVCIRAAVLCAVVCATSVLAMLTRSRAAR